eukprot:CAMPEP_0181200436 /NCGR_PEP_ID=MMETSP1096-20121128/17759_1 /TAXON_ID=156174 ORGANISM="Chrysochromulina ericina, Strain CCMP281" /NCGR_SAMPLE_ID=MMETSP1096 /ASSEMBLY_ACC=CAM_ASM_000453 /LENGTH=91 /DNA_ID=CAMNT_0023290785 /DNA_START=556 /DNA_END=832 /DNA_ORIENTATION=+
MSVLDPKIVFPGGHSQAQQVLSKLFFGDQRIATVARLRCLLEHFDHVVKDVVTTRVAGAVTDPYPEHHMAESELQPLSTKARKPSSLQAVT